MKPTTNQILAALEYPLDYQAEDGELYEVFMETLGGSKQDYQVMHELMTSTVLTVPIEVRPIFETQLDHNDYKKLQIPVEPIEDERDRLVCLAWLIWPSKRLDLVGRELNLLRQAYNAELLRASYTETTDSKGKLVKRIDPGIVTLAFELAGIQAPWDYTFWREPDNQEVPRAGNMPNLPSLGNVVVHYHNGERALVTGAGGTVAQVVNVTSIESMYDGFIKNITKEKKPKQTREEATLEKGKALAAKFL